MMRVSSDSKIKDGVEADQSLDYQLNFTTQPLASQWQKHCVDWGVTSPRFDAKTERWMAPRPELDDKKSWLESHRADLEALSEAAASGTCPDMLLLGDSITENWNRFVNRSSRFGFERRPGVMTFAIGGDRIQDLGWRLFEGGGIEALQKCSPAHIVLMIGTNEVVCGEDVSVAQKELRLLVQQLQKAKPRDSHLVLHAMFPRDEKSFKNWNCHSWDPIRHTELISQMKSELKKLANTTRSTFLDCEAMVNLHVPNAFHTDHVHPSPEGYKRWNSCLKAAGLPPVLSAC
jgi:lysophospholipase L1-like esterase